MASAVDPLGEHQLARLLEVGRGLVSELDTESVLNQVLAVARELTGADYAALGVLDRTGQRLEQFVTDGIDDETQKLIGALPSGHGVLGVLIETPDPLRLPDVSRHPQSYGFPPGHPPMRTFLGVPIRVRGEVYGNLYLTEKAGGAEFDAQDEQVVSVLADWAGVAIANARSYALERTRREELERAVRGLQATMDVGRALGGETDIDRVLELIVQRARALIHVEAVLILLVDESGRELSVVALAGAADRGIVGDTVPVDGSLSGEVLRTRQARRLDDEHRLRHALADRDLPQEGLLMPLVLRGRAVGVLAALDKAGRVFDAEDEQLLASFASSAATAVATAQQVAAQGLRRSIEVSERERTRWARELHDETLQELAGLKVLLHSAKTEDEAVQEAIEQIEMSITGLRHLITELRPAALDAFGLGAAVEGLVGRIGAVTGLEFVADVSLAFEAGQVATRLEPEAEATLYRVVQEGLNNAARHAQATTVNLTILEADGVISVEIQDDGVGFDPAGQTAGFGLVGMRERVELVGGALTVESAGGRGTTVRARVPAPHLAG